LYFVQSTVTVVGVFVPYFQTRFTAGTVKYCLCVTGDEGV
jgi:hypothetical protein